MGSIRCPECGNAFDWRAATARPFCSERCRRLDLRRWLDEEYMVSCPRADSERDPWDDEPIDLPQDEDRNE